MMKVQHKGDLFTFLGSYLVRLNSDFVLVQGVPVSLDAGGCPPALLRPRWLGRGTRTSPIPSKRLLSFSGAVGQELDSIERAVLVAAGEKGFRSLVEQGI